MTVAFTSSHRSEGKRELKYTLKREPPRSVLEDLRAEFAVAKPAADFHVGPDFSHAVNDLAVIVHGDAIAAAQRRVRAEHAHDALDMIETVL